MRLKSIIGMFLAILLAVICATPSAKADTINVFSISGTGYVNCASYQSFTFQSCGPAEDFAGALEIDATTDVPIDMAGLIPGFGSFGSSFPGFFSPPGLEPVGADSNGSCLFQGEPVIAEYLVLCFTTPTPGSLVGFDGGAITGYGLFDNSNYQYFSIASGSITPVIASAPEPSSLLLLMLGLGGLAFAVIRKRKESRCVLGPENQIPGAADYI